MERGKTMNSNHVKRLARRRRFEEKQFSRLARSIDKVPQAYYFGVMIVLIILVDLLDNFTTSSTENITSSIITDFFVNGQVFGRSYTYEEGLSVNNVLSLFCKLLAIAAPFYKSLGDKYGRKPLLAISTCGMAVGMLIIYISKSYVVYLLGTVLMTFFLGSDIQIIYVLEESPSKHRAKIYSILKATGALGVAFIPLLRNLVMRNDATQWREIFKLPGLVGLLIAVLVILFARETRVFVKQKYEYLSIPFEERIEKEQQEKLEKKANANKNGVFNAIRYIWQHKEIRILILTKTVFDAALVAMTYYESVMFKAGMPTEDITTAEFFYPFIYAAALLLSGFIADKFGRKNTIQLFGVTCVASYILFILSANSLQSPILVGCMYGLYLGSYWIGRDYMQIMVTEMVPTDIRASVIGGAAFFMLAGMVFGSVFMTISVLFIPIWVACVVLAVPLITLSVILLKFKVRETMGIDYEMIGG